MFRILEEMSFVPLALSSMVVEISLIIFESCPFADWRGRTIFNIARIIMIPVAISIANIMIFALSERVNWLSNAVEALFTSSSISEYKVLYASSSCSVILEPDCVDCKNESASLLSVPSTFDAFSE